MTFFSAILKSLKSNYIKRGNHLKMKTLIPEKVKKKTFCRRILSSQEKEDKYWEMLDKLSDEEFVKEVRKRIIRLEKITKDAI